mmetsp:Transcript_615/g.1804  ORF Transcript_615/g.1804 Transcript_615/m.1804 type:complete len:210 (-) Transcript_615:207-836(-)
MPTFLLEDLHVLWVGLLRAPWVEHRIQVNVHEIVKVPRVAGGHRVARPVRVSERVEERVQTRFHELHEGLLDRVLPRPAQHRVLQNVRHPRRVLHRRPEHGTKGLVLVGAVHGHELCSCSSVTIQHTVRAVLLDEFLLDHLEPMLLGNLWTHSHRDLDIDLIRRCDGEGRLVGPVVSSERVPGPARSITHDASPQLGQHHRRCLGVCCC